MNRNWKILLPVQIIFITVALLGIFGKILLEQWNVNVVVLSIGNLLLFLITWASFYMAQRGLKSPNPNVFFRAVYASIMIKLFICIIAAFLYISINKHNLNKPALFTCMGLYLAYTFAEVSVLMKLLKQKTK